MNIKHIACALALGASSLFASQANAQTAVGVRYSTTLYSGPSISYPSILPIYPSRTVYLYGCLDDYAWCDVSYSGMRGWVDADALSLRYDTSDWSYPIVSFVFTSYWDSYYRNRPWYQNRYYWNNWDWRPHSHHWNHRPGWNRPPNGRPGNDWNRPPHGRPDGRPDNGRPDWNGRPPNGRPDGRPDNGRPGGSDTRPDWNGPRVPGSRPGGEGRPDWNRPRPPEGRPSGGDSRPGVNPRPPQTRPQNGGVNQPQVRPQTNRPVPVSPPRQVEGRHSGGQAPMRRGNERGDRQQEP